MIFNDNSIIMSFVYAGIELFTLSVNNHRSENIHKHKKCDYVFFRRLRLSGSCIDILNILLSDDFSEQNKTAAIINRSKRFDVRPMCVCLILFYYVFFLSFWFQWNRIETDGWSTGEKQRQRVDFVSTLCSRPHPIHTHLRTQEQPYISHDSCMIFTVWFNLCVCDNREHAYKRSSIFTHLQWIVLLYVRNIVICIDAGLTYYVWNATWNVCWLRSKRNQYNSNERHSWTDVITTNSRNLHLIFLWSFTFVILIQRLLLLRLILMRCVVIKMTRERET